MISNFGMCQFDTKVFLSLHQWCPSKHVPYNDKKEGATDILPGEYFLPFMLLCVFTTIAKYTTVTSMKCQHH